MAIVIPSTAPTYDDDTLWAIRQKVAELSGRYDLVTSAGEDAGVDFYIRAGQNFLDRILDIERLQARYYKTLGIGEDFILLPRLRFFSAVFITDMEGNNRYRLVKLRPDQKDISCTVGGSPAYYRPLSHRLVQSPDDIDPIQLGLLDAPNDSEVAAVKILPPPDKEILVEVVGHFYSRALTVSASTSFWTIHYPEILIQASLLQIEKFMRNTEGVNDQLNALLMDVRQLDFDHVAMQIVDVDQMEG